MNMSKSNLLPSLAFHHQQHQQQQSSTWQALLTTYASYLTHHTPPPPNLLPPLLTSPATPHHLLPILHQHTIVLGYTSDAHISSSLISTYSKSGLVATARKLFDAMPVRTVVPWSAIINAYSNVGDAESAFSLFNRMRWEGVGPNSVTVLGLLPGIFELVWMQCLHGWVVRCGFGEDVVVGNKMLDVYFKCGGGEFSRRLFESMCLRDVVSWNSMMSGYSKDGNVRECVGMLKRMRMQGMNPDHKSFGSIVSLATATGSCPGGLVELGRQVHAQIVMSGFESDTQLGTTLVVMYLKCKNVDCASLLFHRTQHKDVIAWTAMMSGLVQNDRVDEALLVFQQMLRSRLIPTGTTIATALAASAHLVSLRHGASIHGYVIRRRVPVDRAAENSLISMYAKCGCLKQSRSIFDAMRDKDVVSWNAMVSAYAQSGHLKDASILFNQMRLSKIQPDSITTVTLLQACAALGTLHYGRFVHSFIITSGLTRSCISVTTALVDMYSKCGDLTIAQRCFDALEEHDLVSWTAIIATYGSHGLGVAAMQTYSEFILTGMKPNQVMLLSVLAACSHAGLVHHGLEIFHSMKQDFGIEPSVEHTASIVDLLGRAGMIQEALEIIRTMPAKANAEILGILLDACRIHRNFTLAEEIAEQIAALKPVTAGSYVQLAHSYAAISRWDCVEESWRQMKSLGLRKAPAWSFIELNGTITTFFADHDSHPQYEEMILLLKVLDGEMRKLKCPSVSD